jgi:hypothetical protein
VRRRQRTVVAVTLALPSSTPIPRLARLVATNTDPQRAASYRAAAGLSRGDRAAALIIAAALDDPDPQAASTAAARTLTALHTQPAAAGPFNEWLSRTVATAVVQAAVTEPDDMVVQAAARLLARIEADTGVRSGFTAAQLTAVNQAASSPRRRDDDPGHVRATAIYRAMLWLFIVAVAAAGLFLALADHRTGSGSDTSVTTRPSTGASEPATAPSTDTLATTPPVTAPPAARPTTTAPVATVAPPAARGGEYANCSAARAGGAAPVFAGDPGYGRHLDRDGDGIGCE